MKEVYIENGFRVTKVGKATFKTRIEPIDYEPEEGIETVNDSSFGEYRS